MRHPLWHPAARSGLTLDRYVACAHILVTQRADERGVVDEALRSRGLVRRVAVTVPQVATVPFLLADTNLIATVGQRAATRLAQHFELALQPVPLDLPPWHMDMIWARRNDGDPGLAWLREQFHQAVDGSGATEGQVSAS